MEVKEILEEMKYCTGSLPKEAIKEAIKQKEEIIPKLLEMLEYTKENLENIVKGEDDFFGYTYSFFLLAEFREKRCFPYLIELINMDEEIVDYILGDDYPEYLPRLIASCYNGDDKALFDIIENENIDEFIRSSVLQVFAILYLNDIKTRKFLTDYFIELIENRKDDSYLYQEIITITDHLCLYELKDKIKDIYDLVSEREIEDLEEKLKDKDYVINIDDYPINPFYEYIYDVIEIMELWQCFRENEDEEFLNSYEYKMCEDIGLIRKKQYMNSNNKKMGRNDLCYCGSGKKYKKCCIQKEIDMEMLEKLEFIDSDVCKAGWYLEREENSKAYESLRMALIWVMDICNEKNIKSVSEYDKCYPGYDFLSNWIQMFEDVLEYSKNKRDQYNRIKIIDFIEETFTETIENDLFVKERYIRSRANAEFRLGNEEKAINIIEEHLKMRPEWIWGYIEMADWYEDKFDFPEKYDLEKNEKILKRAEEIPNIEEIDILYERLEYLYSILGDKEKEKYYSLKVDEVRKDI